MAELKELHVYLRGGLGNQLFQYSTGRYLAKKYDRNLILRGDLLPLEEDKIDGISRWPTQINTFRHVGRIYSQSSQPRGKTNFLGKSMQALRRIGDFAPGFPAIFGWIASETTNSPLPKNTKKISRINSYCSFKHLAWAQREELRDEILSLKKPSLQFLELVREISVAPTVVVHLRLGDYMHLKDIYGQLSLDYFTNVLAFLFKNSLGLRLWIFTDSPFEIDVQLINILKPERIIGPADLPQPIENLVLMSKGIAMIASNSTFSWWACYLSDSKSRKFAPIFDNAATNVFSPESDKVHGWELLHA